MECAKALMQVLFGKTLCYGLKSPDTELYDFGFGDVFKPQKARDGSKALCSHILHVLCRFKVIDKTANNTTEIYYEDTSYEDFNAKIEKMLGLKVLRVALSSKNDLWLDFGKYWIVFATWENDKESWRFFSTDRNISHLVVSNSWIEYGGKTIPHSTGGGLREPF